MSKKAPAPHPGKKKSGGVFFWTGFLQGPSQFPHNVELAAGQGVSSAGSGLGSGLKSFWIGTIANPVAKDFQHNRGKVVIGIIAGLVLVGSAVKIVSGNEGVKGLATSAIAPEVEGLSLVKNKVTGGAHARLQAREPLAPVRYAMRKAHP